MPDQERRTIGIESEEEGDRKPRRDGKWALGLLLIVLGIIFLLNSSDVLPELNWPALFLSVPVLVLFASAYQRFRQSGSALERDVRAPFILGVVLLLFMGMLLMQWDWSDISLPAFLIFAGFAGLLQVLDRKTS